VDIDQLAPPFEDAAFVRSLDELVRGFSEQVAIADENWTVIAVNEAWKSMIGVAGYPQLTCGTNYRDFLETFAGRGHENAVAVMRGVDAIDAGEATSFQLTYAGVDSWEGRTLQLRVNRLHINGRTLATITRQDITDSAELCRLRETFNSSLLESQAEARRGLAREFHDSTAQLLTSAGLLLCTLKQKSPTTDSIDVVEEVQELVSEAQQEIRSISYLAHPPALDEVSLEEALKALAEGFGRRTGLPIFFERLGPAADLADTSKNTLYRIAQEALSNVHRHASAESAHVCLCVRKTMAHLIVSDDGVGLSPEMLAGARRDGVGLAGMRSRLAEIGGRLSIRALEPGTAICTSAPIQKADLQASACSGKATSNGYILGGAPGLRDSGELPFQEKKALRNTTRRAENRASKASRAATRSKRSGES
jgi:signal transduction histidine kinase